jgi:predicted transposase YbfD/YdcC
MLFIEGCIITIDAIGTQKEIADQIIEQKGDYILSLKGNQSNLHEEVRTLFEEQKEENYRDIDPDKIQQKTTIEKGHGRIEKRTYCKILYHKSKK